MIYGLNFNRTQIPPKIKRLFAAKIKLSGMGRGEYAVLQGAATTFDDLHHTILQADNGRRKLTIRRRSTFYGVYTY